MKIIDLIQNKKKPLLSFEVFPPNRNSSFDSVENALGELAQLQPDFISVTYGAAGGGREQTAAIAGLIRKKHSIEALAHLTCIGAGKTELIERFAEMQQAGVKNVLAMRGDLPTEGDNSSPDDYRFASDLIAELKTSWPEACIAAACYPEGHIECDSLVRDIQHLKYKVDTGADFLISQLFFDNELYYAFLDRAAAAGIRIPILPGIMPVLGKKQILRIISLCGATLPKKFARLLNRYENDPQSMEAAGIAYATEQIIDLIASGAEGIHLYTMNKPHVAQAICNNISALRKPSDA